MDYFIVIAMAGFATGITTLLFGFGGGFVVVPFVYHFVNTTGVGEGNGMRVAVATSTAVMILNAGYATYTNWRRGHLHSEALTPLLVPIGVGAALGAGLADLLGDSLLRILFSLYLAGTLLDGLLRKGFLGKSAPRSIGPATRWAGGALIGAIATLLGVGGSVMTVPLLRRHGYDMKYCVSAANPLSMPVAIVGTVMYAWLGQDQSLGAEYLGYVNTRIFGVLVIAGVAGMLFAKHCIPVINDRLHARAYLLLLLLMLIVSLWP
ncbi:sulfite exporter TauE/SafE family protein [Alloalcanivorax xenomutans]|jgi:uncharacterized protein|uniref:Probable membrane transporter protein n=1 Tax=Alloalcanivorax xenomutans TaxID=1094342 RepID=A0A9Q3W758_9GAMM|nr:sulfite exporter TauE/SafE family protein [Alloalcanivorax xenomutans]ARB45062.1 hypothetical protein P40_06190 [Alloalcanivorax xenomutans]MCE7509067.1 sulfite exporter TauE/SafE family protein [Alloalcanivorax xenomutans]